MNYCNRLVLVGLSLLTAGISHAAFAMTPGAAITLRVDCHNNYGDFVKGSVSLVRLAGGGFHERGQYGYGRSVQESVPYLAAGGYWVVVQQSQQQPRQQPPQEKIRYSVVDRDRPRVETLGEVVSALEKNFLEQGYQCRFYSHVEVKNW